MPNKPQLNLILLVYLLFSAFGLVTIVALLLYYPTTTVDVSLRKPVVGSIFILICMVGGSATLFPKECSKIFGSHGENSSFAFHSTFSDHAIIKGHHPECTGFSPHIIKTRAYVLCAACVGLFLGSAIATVGAVAYFFAGLAIQQFSVALAAMGIGFVVLGFVQFKFRGFMRLVLNALFVVGAFSILAGIDASIGNLFIDFYIVSLVIVWILTRILLSEWNHSQICQTCSLECKIRK